MPTAKPRLNITLPSETEAAVARLARASGESKAGVVASFIVAVTDQMNVLAEVLENAKGARQEVLQNFGHTIDQANVNLLAVLDTANETAATLLQSIKDATAAQLPSP